MVSWRTKEDENLGEAVGKVTCSDRDGSADHDMLDNGGNGGEGRGEREVMLKGAIRVKKKVDIPQSMIVSIRRSVCR